MFSVVIPLYNKEAHIAKTLDSVLSQTYSEFEIIVVDDGSTDNGAPIVNSFDDARVKLFHQENAGVSTARNRGICEANFEYIAFLDADDFWDADYLLEMSHLIESSPGCGLYGSAYSVVDKSGCVIKDFKLPINYMHGNFLVKNYFKSLFEFGSFIWTSSVCVPKSVFYDFDIWFPVGQAYGEDQYVWSRIAMCKPVAYTASVNSFYLIDADNNTASKLESRVEPSPCILELEVPGKEYLDKHSFSYLKKYLERHAVGSVRRNARNGRRLIAIRQLFAYRISVGMFALCVVEIITFTSLRRILKAVKDCF
ncbi:glycosyltransferase family A protein [Halomonas sp. SSL-5]|uniref:glycosyltransferase family 2 protein n=1 Tax=Halomonas sp. SSL-5 TaxID=3065855 RepID=UPI0027390106|nr:glycosyltransferase family A protein [Halomonas sp. SSL-5]MDY7116711.1 glycosyltransferase family A protein [Halomonas sp. SSL-5]